MALNNKMMVALAVMWLVVVTTSLVVEVAGKDPVATCLRECLYGCEIPIGVINQSCVNACIKACCPNDKPYC